MTHVVTDACVKCKYTDCVDVCPVKNCFHEHPMMLVINPDKCIDCGLCVSECPVSAIAPESEENSDFITLARKLSKTLPPITHSKSPLEDADLYSNQKNKCKKYIKI